METVQTLTEARDDAVRSSKDIEGKIAHARLEGDDKALARLRGRRDAALRDADEADGAIALAEEREQQAREEAKALRGRELVKEVKRVRAERLKAAAKVDEALVALEKAMTGYRLLGRELGILTKTSTVIARRESQHIRWAVWKSAEGTADLMCVPFANGGRRKKLVELEATG